MNVNGVNRTVSADPRTPVLEVLREEFGLRGTKYGCGEGECGACTIIADGQTICACLATCGSLAEAEVTTVEGLENDPAGVRLFNSFIDNGAVQCGFCTPGFVVSAWGLLTSAKKTDADSIRDALGGNLCRCTGYTKIIEAVADAGSQQVLSPLSSRMGSVTADVCMPQRYWRPRTLAQLFSENARFAIEARFIAGGTDLMVQNEHHLGDLPLIDISSMPELSGIDEMEQQVRIGATTTWSEIRYSSIVGEHFPLLSLAAAEIGGIQIQNRATIGGNIVNASPAADGLPALYVYKAEIELVSAEGRRTVPICDFITGPGRTGLRGGEMVSAVLLAKTGTAGRVVAFFEKVGPRKAQTISKASLAFHAQLIGGRLRDVRIGLGAVGPTVIRPLEVERFLEHQSNSAGFDLAAKLISKAARPIDDIRSTANYRRALAGGLLLRGLKGADIALTDESAH